MEIVIPGFGRRHVHALKGMHSLAKDYHFELEIAIADVSYELLGKQARLLIGERAIPGIIKHIHGRNYQLVSPLNRLRNLQTQRILCNVTIQDIIKEVLAKLDSVINYRWQLTTNFPKHEMIRQCSENDYRFLQRQIAYHGLLYTFSLSEEQIELLISDTWPFTSSLITLPYQSERGKQDKNACIYALSQYLQVKPQRVYLQGERELTPNMDLSCIEQNRSLIPGMGQRYFYAAGFSDLAWGQSLSKLCLESIDTTRERYLAKTNCCQLQPGDLLQICDHPIFHLNGYYRVIAIHHHMLSHEMGYHNSVRLVKANSIYRLPWPSPPPFYSHDLATIAGIKERTPALDSKGRYKIKYHLAKHNNVSKPVRLMRSSCGVDYGLHFPLLPDSQVVIANLHQSLDTPLILGVLANPRFPNPVTYSNRYQSILASWADHQLLFDDDKRASRLSLSASQQAVFEMYSSAKRSYSRFLTKKGKIICNAGQAIYWRAKRMHQRCKQYKLVVGGEQTIAAKGDIVFQSGLSLQMKGENSITLNTACLDFENKNGHFHTDTSLAITVAKGDFKGEAEEILLKASNCLEIEAGQTIILQAGKSQIILSADGQIVIKALRIYLYN